jgi:hypothetical protein
VPVGSIWTTASRLPGAAPLFAAKTGGKLRAASATIGVSELEVAADVLDVSATCVASGADGAVSDRLSMSSGRSGPLLSQPPPVDQPISPAAVYTIVAQAQRPWRASKH